MVVKRKPAATPDGVKVTRRTLSDYAQDQHNLNKGTVRGLALHEKSVDEFGAARSIVADKNGVILAGNKTADRLFDAGITDVIEVETDGTQLVVVKRSDLDIETERGRLYTLADNRVAQVSIDFDGAELQALLDQKIDLSTYFDDNELQELLDAAHEGDEPPGDPGAKIDRADELQAKRLVKSGDLYTIPSKSGKGEHRLLCGDSTNADDVARVMGGEKATLMINDPPYGMRLDADFSEMKSGLKFAKDKGAFGGRKYDDIVGDHEDYDPRPIINLFEHVSEQFWFGADYYSARLTDTMHSGAWLVWDKRLDESADLMYGSCFELIWSKRKHKRDILRFKWAGVFGVEQEIEKMRFHPNQKPSALIANIISRYSNVSDVIIDCYGGSGTTLVACEQTQRQGRAIEIEPKYVAVALERLSLMGLTPTKG